MHIILASDSTIKRQAVTQAFSMCGLRPTMSTINVPSGIAAQPFGEEETMAGARNRAQAVFNMVGGLRLYIGIENGLMVNDKNQYVDKAAIVMMSRKGDIYQNWSQDVVVPDQYVAEARRRGFATTTYGQIMKEAGAIDNHADPHQALTGQSRATYLRNAILGMIPTLQLAAALPPSPPVEPSHRLHRLAP